MKPSVAPSDCSTAISSRRAWISRRTVLPTTSSAPRPSSAASTQTTRSPKPSQRSRRARQTASCWTKSVSGSGSSDAASRVSSRCGRTINTLGSGFSPTDAIASAYTTLPLPASRRLARPCSGVRKATPAMSLRARRLVASARARSTVISGFRNTVTSRARSMVPPKRAALSSTSAKPTGSASATAITPTVSSVDHGLPIMRPRLATRL